MECTLFSIDNGHDIRTMKRFLRHVDTLTAMDLLVGDVIPCVGYWEDQLEDSFIMLSVDYEKVKDFTKNQVAVVLIPSDPRQPCILDYGFVREPIGPMRQVKNPFGLPAWTYNKITKAYFSTYKEV